MEETQTGAFEKRENGTYVTEFILLGLGKLEDFSVLLFFVFLMIYTLILTGNVLIIVLIVSEQNLHTPMYYFLANMSCLEVCYSSTILPKMIADFLSDSKSMSVWGCFMQLFCFGYLVIVECYLLSVMSYDRFVAICKPLYYSMIMNNRVIFICIASSWLCATLILVIIVCLVAQLSFCGPKQIDHFFCDFSPVLQLSCTDTSNVRLLALIFGSIDIFPPFILTIASYVCIITAILKIPSTTGRQKAFATCSSHLIVVTIFYGTLTIVYILPDTGIFRDVKKIFSIPYTILTPMINPLVYTLRNQEVKKSLKKALSNFI
ncbi:olfactory receptor 5AP2-like [Erythrolamprus reginae]|uniref:olfactory receptor 5AP2-like n=1 Tax=Erythrolamprus reginae TaxID=121349 RepID=UPI00396CD79D